MCAKIAPVTRSPHPTVAARTWPPPRRALCRSTPTFSRRPHMCRLASLSSAPKQSPVFPPLLHSSAPSVDRKPAPEAAAVSSCSAESPLTGAHPEPIRLPLRADQKPPRAPLLPPWAPLRRPANSIHPAATFARSARALCCSTAPSQHRYPCGRPITGGSHRSSAPLWEAQIPVSLHPISASNGIPATPRSLRRPPMFSN
jgi:hypothetical protein